MTPKSTEAVTTLGVYACDGFSAALCDYRQGLRQTWHSHDRSILTLLLAGYTREQVGCRDIVAGPLEVGVKPAAVRHQDHFWPNGVRALRLELSEKLFAGVEASPVMKRWDWLRSSDALKPLLRIATLLRDKSSGDEIELNLFDCLAGLVSQDRSGATGDPPDWLRQSLEQIENSYATGVRLSQLAAFHRVHPVYFARMFRRFFGCTVGQYVRRLQLRAAFRLIAEGRHGLAEIAAHAGFSDQSHMTRAFAEKYGLTPGECRGLVR
jgi:AraC family transcriptional regulator